MYIYIYTYMSVCLNNSRSLTSYEDFIHELSKSISVVLTVLPLHPTTLNSVKRLDCVRGIHENTLVKFFFLLKFFLAGRNPGFFLTFFFITMNPHDYRQPWVLKFNLHLRMYVID